METINTIIITIIGTVLATGITAILGYLIHRFKVKRQVLRRNRRVKKAEQKMNRKRTWKVALRNQQTGLLYQCGKVRCSEKRLAELELPFLLGRAVPGYLLTDFFTADELLECSEEVAWDCWEECDFDKILSV